MTTGTAPTFGKFRLKGSEPDGDNSRARKRNRKTLSCVHCRRSKVKCDRGIPCGRCSKTGRKEKCSYGLETPSPNGQYESGRRLPSQSKGTHEVSPILMNTGLTHWAKLIEELGDVKRYIFNQDADFHETFDRITAIKDLYPTPSSYNFPFGDNQLDIPMLAQDAILDHLPSRTLVLDLVDNYMTTYEKTHRLLHPYCGYGYRTAVPSQL
ncbi:Oleate activated transcription factor 3 [Cytospora mali]|uniref:Oleate activated transcription factor 3 n=1 Tax=Cytospora mali TaxID=578113 RepID=A0A194VVA1_CYTMA|nr:Oleate activated transcription factor 3 [Valsa mali]